jgi:hypothetical protein
VTNAVEMQLISVGLELELKIGNAGALAHTALVTQAVIPPLPPHSVVTVV